MEIKEFYFVKYRECSQGDYNKEEKWEHFNTKTNIHPLLDSSLKSDYWTKRVIDFYIKITEEEYNY